MWKPKYTIFDPATNRYFWIRRMDAGWTQDVESAMEIETKEQALEMLNNGHFWELNMADIPDRVVLQEVFVQL